MLSKPIFNSYVSRVLSIDNANIPVAQLPDVLILVVVGPGTVHDADLVVAVLSHHDPVLVLVVHVYSSHNLCHMQEMALGKVTPFFKIFGS